MNYKQLIKSWHSRCSSEDPFSRFVFEYLAFVAFLVKIKFVEVKNDRDAIQKLKQDVGFKASYLEEIQRNEELKSAWESIKDELNEFRLGNATIRNDEVEEIKWWNYSGDNLDQQTQEEGTKIRGVIYDLEDWENMVEFWYSIRNNLFHGSKNPESRRDQLLVEHGHKTLGPLVEIFLNSGNVRNEMPKVIFEEAAEKFAQIVVMQIQEDQKKKENERVVPQTPEGN